MHTSILVKYTCSLINCDVSVDVVWMPAWVLGMVGEGHSWSSCTEDNRQLAAGLLPSLELGTALSSGQLSADTGTGQHTLYAGWGRSIVNMEHCIKSLNLKACVVLLFGTRIIYTICRFRYTSSKGVLVLR